MARKVRIPVCSTENKSSNETTNQNETKTVNAKAERCMSPGPLQRNPYLNFLREYRKKFCGLSAVETVRRGAQAWKALTAEQRAQYIVQAFYTRNRKRRLRNVSTSAGRRRAVKSRRSSRSRKVKKRARSTH